MCIRDRFPVLPSHAITVHRVQGATLDNDVHVLLNSEFFAPGQAYTALSRARRLKQLHLWGFDLKAIIADPRVAREYTSDSSVACLRRSMSTPLNRAYQHRFPTCRRSKHSTRPPPDIHNM